MKKALLYFAAIIVLFIIGFMLYNSFINLSFLFLNKGEIRIFSNSISGRFSSRLFFAISISIIPLFYLWVHYFSNLKDLRQKIITYLLIIGGGILSWQCRIIVLNYRLSKSSEISAQLGVNNSISLEHLDFDSYLFIGYAIGTILSILVFRNRNTPTDNL
ncbi:hypothetical protein [uncultured Aquimarina sp.]|uniref:hypothetical protein n=1 Tax=uncultured Aquimarina sp. TaxID=575652 RepID=UPI00262B30EF|nr:hypothetical protein [uncultured Aquimarina sp.]